MVFSIGDGGEERKGSENFEKRNGVPNTEGIIMQREDKSKCSTA